MGQFKKVMLRNEQQKKIAVSWVGCSAHLSKSPWVYKAGLIQEMFSLCLPISKKDAKALFTKKKCLEEWIGTFFFGDLSQIEILSEIKTPLVIWEPVSLT